jgi:multidrug efflux system outer membrane protein
MRSFNTQRDRNTLLLEATNAASNAAKLAKERFDLGADGLIVVLDAERTLLEAERSLVDSEISVLLSIVDTYTAFAGGWEVTQAN